MTQTKDYDVEYDSYLGYYTLHYRGEVVILNSDSYDSALTEAEAIVVEWASLDL